MLRLSRPTAYLLTGAALLSGLSAWERLADESDASPLARAADRVEARAPDDRPDLESARVTTLAQSQRLHELTADVAEGRASLLDGAARLRDVCRAWPEFSWFRFREVTPGASDDERFCHMLIGRVRLLPRRDAEQAGAVVSRLEAELEARTRDGMLRLPE
jgi:hypothetical protein